MAKEIYRRYEMERDENGMPTKLWWRGDYLIESHPKNRAEIDKRKLEEWEALYGKRTE